MTIFKQKDNKKTKNRCRSGGCGWGWWLACRCFLLESE